MKKLEKRMSKMGLATILMMLACSMGLAFCYADMGFAEEAIASAKFGICSGGLLGIAIILSATSTDLPEAKILRFISGAMGTLLLVPLLRYSQWYMPELVTVGLTVCAALLLLATIICHTIEQRHRRELDVAYQQISVAKTSAGEPTLTPATDELAHDSSKIVTFPSDR